jgi:hypothetical protein
LRNQRPPNEPDTDEDLSYDRSRLAEVEEVVRDKVFDLTRDESEEEAIVGNRVVNYRTV